MMPIFSMRRQFLKRATAFGLCAVPALSAVVSACRHTVNAATAPFGPWQSRLFADHPLVGRMFDCSKNAGIDLAELKQRIADNTLLILGETHDNPDHHRIQARLFRHFAEGRKSPPAAVFEMIPYDLQERLDTLRERKGIDADDVFDAVDWDHSGWPPRDLYRPLMQTVLALGAPIIAAGLPRTRIKALIQSPDSALSRQEIGILRLGPLPRDLQKALEKDIVKSHCDMISPQTAHRMSLVQRMRDALMARHLALAHADHGSAALVCGDGHARKDWAVPLYIRRQRTGSYFGLQRKKLPLPDPLVIWQAEIREKAKDVKDLMPEGTSPERLADIVIVTPRAKRKDQCEEFRRFLQRKGQGK